MTIGIERWYALVNTKEFLNQLLDREKTPRVPLSVRRDARWCLKHFPEQKYMEILKEILVQLDDPTAPVKRDCPKPKKALTKKVGRTAQKRGRK